MTDQNPSCRRPGSGTGGSQRSGGQRIEGSARTFGLGPAVLDHPGRRAGRAVHRVDRSARGHQRTHRELEFGAPEGHGHHAHGTHQRRRVNRVLRRMGVCVRVGLRAKSGPLEAARSFVARFHEGDVKVSKKGKVSADLHVTADPFVLHRVVNDALHQAEVPVMAFSPCI